MVKRDYSFPLIRILGIQVRIHLSFFLIVALFALGATAPGGPGLLDAMAWLALIFLCVLIHEMAHSLVARRRGARVRAIVLLPIGGVSQLEDLPESPRDEFAIAFVGPVASFALAGIAFIAAALLRVRLWPIDLYAGPILGRLAWFNLIVGIFNLVPAFPLDGGRVLRSLLNSKKSLESATRQAARIGRAVAVAMIAAGVLFNIWLIVIGIFIFFGASTEEVATIIHARMKGVKAKDVMVVNPVVLDAKLPVREIRDALRATTQREFPVTDSDEYVGMATATVISLADSEATLGELADRDWPAAAPDDEVEEVERSLLLPAGRDAVAVVDRGRIVGLLTQSDVGRLIERALDSRGGIPIRGSISEGQRPGSSQ